MSRSADPAIEPMRLEDLPEVRRIEALSIPSPWPAGAYRSELLRNPFAHYIVARVDERRLAGYGGLWVQHDELHVSMMAVDPEYRGRGLGSRLLVTLIRIGMREGCRRATLEVRQFNRPALALYGRFGFEMAGRRERYYRDTGEDALILTTPDFDDADWRRRFEGLARK